MLAGLEFLEVIGISWEVCKIWEERAFWEVQLVSEVHGLWEADGVQGILLGIFGVLLGRWLERKESKTPAKSLAGEERHT